MTIRTNTPTGAPAWFDCSTHNVEESERFYGDLFGWKFDPQTDATGELTYALALRDGHLAAGLMPIPAGNPMPAMWNTYIAVDDADATCAHAVELGATTVMPPTDAMDAGRMAFIADPTGAVLGLWQAHHHLGVEVVDEPGGYCWADLMTTDTAQAAEFYGALFGWEFVPRTEGPMPYAEFRSNGTPVAGCMDLPPDAIANGAPPYWGVYFAVTDTDAALATATAAGAQVLWGPMGIPVGRMTGIMDPQGAVVAFIELAQET